MKHGGSGVVLHVFTGLSRQIDLTERRGHLSEDL